MIFLMKRKAPEQEKWGRKLQRDLTAIIDVCQLGSTAYLAFIQNKLVLVNNAAGPECGILWHVLK